jgi:hypothetical protein
MCTVDGITFVSVLDLNMGFWTIQLNNESQRLATVILPWGKYSYQCLAMGLFISPNIYQEKMSAIFSDMETVICFIDDIALITNRSFGNHLNKLDEILQQLKENNLQVNGNKSSFCAIEAKFLGFVLTQQGVKPQVKKVKAIVKIPKPKTVKQVYSFIGMINY